VAAVQQKARISVHLESWIALLDVQQLAGYLEPVVPTRRRAVPLVVPTLAVPSCSSFPVKGLVEDQTRVEVGWGSSEFVVARLFAMA